MRLLRSVLGLGFHAATAVILVACTGSSDGTPEPTSTATATATAMAATATAEPQTTTRPADNTPAAGAPGLAERLSSGGPFVVVGGQVGSEQTRSRSWPVVEVVTIDATGEAVAGFRFGEVDRFVQSWDLVEDNVIVGFETEIVRYHLDGTVSSVLRSGEDRQYQSVLISPDGTRIVFAESGDPGCGVACVVFADAQTGEELGRVPQIGTELETFRALAQPAGWRGNDAVLVRGQPNGHAFVGLATVSVDGEVTVLPTNPNGSLSSDGQLLARWSGTVAGYDEAPLTCGFNVAVEVSDVDSGRLVASSTDTSAGVSDTRWSPDSREILIERRALPDPEDTPCDGAYPVWFAMPAEWSLLDLASGVEKAGVTPGEVFSEWFEDWADLACDAGIVRIGVDTDRRRYTTCVDEHRQSLGETTLVLNGVEIARGPFERVLGIVRPKASAEPRAATAAELNALPRNTRLGEPEFDAILDAVMAGDVDVLLDAIEWESRACGGEFAGFPSSPDCLDGEPDGTLVDAVLLIAGEGRWVRAEALREGWERSFPNDFELCAIGRGADGSRSVTLREATLFSEHAAIHSFSLRVVDDAIVSIGDLVDVGTAEQIACRGIFDFEP